MYSKTLEELIFNIPYGEFEVRALSLDLDTSPQKLRFCIDDVLNTDERIVITLETDQFVDFYISPNSSDYLSFEQNHPLLWDHNEAQCDLFISGALNGHEDGITYKLFMHHHYLYGKYCPFDPSISNRIKNRKFIHKGSKRLLDEWAEIFRSFGINATVVGGEEHHNDTKATILFFGESYVITRNYTETIEIIANRYSE